MKGLLVRSGTDKRGMLHGLCLAGAILIFFLFSTAVQAAPSLRMDAQSAMMVEVTTGRVLFGQDAEKPIQPASLTKILSLYLAYEALQEGRIRKEARVKISRKAWRTGGSRMFLEPKAEVTVEEIIKGMSILSANDASVALAEHLGGDEERFVERMNVKARQLGMSQSRFENPHGLPAEGQISTARDLMKLSRAYIRRFPEALGIHAMQTYTYHGITQKNRNRLLGKCPGVDGLKTGFVCEAGYHIIVTAKRGDRRLVAVMLGSRNPRVREKEATRLIEAGFMMLEGKDLHSDEMKGRK
jgi:D-alanyl-D-alanine carboxypeptidase (penicillin-binding protein 5/6)